MVKVVKPTNRGCCLLVTRSFHFARTVYIVSPRPINPHLFGSSVGPAQPPSVSARLGLMAVLHLTVLVCVLALPGAWRWLALLPGLMSEAILVGTLMDLHPKPGGG